MHLHRDDQSVPADLDPSWTIVNAPRPLMGARTWQGPFRHGLFYAAGHPGDDQLRESWDADDAWPVTLVTDADIEVMVADYAAGSGYDLADLPTMGITVADLADEMGLPYGGAR